MPFEWTADPEARLLYQLVVDINSFVHERAQTNRCLQIFAHAALDGVFQEIARQPVGDVVTVQVPGRLHALFKAIAEESLAFAGAVDLISATYLDGADILLPDSRTELDREIDYMCKSATVFAPLAKLFELEPIVVEGYVAGHPIVDRRAADLVNMARVKILPPTCPRGEFLAGC